MKYFVANFNGVMDDIIPHLSIASIENEDVDTILMWQDTQSIFKELSEIAKYLNKKMILLSHCYASCNDYLPPHNYTSYADKILVWGKADYDLAVKAGLAHKTVITGTPIFSHIKPRQKQEQITITFCPTHNPQFENANFEIVEYLKGLHEYKTFCKILEDVENRDRYINQVLSHREKTSHIDICFDIISKSDIVIVNDPTTTFALFAFAAGIPVIYVNNIDTDYHLISNMLISGEYETTLANLSETIKQVLEKDTKQYDREVIAEYCGAYIKNPLRNILTEIA